jgi:hypothetical protein
MADSGRPSTAAAFLLADQKASDCPSTLLSELALDPGPSEGNGGRGDIDLDIAEPFRMVMGAGGAFGLEACHVCACWGLSGTFVLRNRSSSSGELSSRFSLPSEPFLRCGMSRRIEIPGRFTMVTINVPGTCV